MTGTPLVLALTAVLLATFVGPIQSQSLCSSRSADEVKKQLENPVSKVLLIALEVDFNWEYGASRIRDYLAARMAGTPHSITYVILHGNIHLKTTYPDLSQFTQVINSL